MELKIFSVGPLSTNCYLLWDTSTLEATLIDPGDDGDFLSEQILALSLHLTRLLLTHGHFDHVLGLLPLHLNFPDVPIYLHPADHFLYAQAITSAKHWVNGYLPDPLPELRATNLPQEAIPSPGHTPGSVCYYYPQPGWLFTGDTLFKSGVGATNHRYSSPLKLSTSLAQLNKLPGDTLVYPGHGDPTTLATELT